MRGLGGSGIEVSRLILGCGNFGGIGSAPAFFGQGETREQAFALMDAAWEAGITTFDTADAYGGGRSESWIGEWRAAKGADVRERLVLSTKVFHSVEGRPGDSGLAPERVRRQVEGSLRRLGVERIDMYLTHEPDPDTAVADTLAALDELVASGTIGAYGVSNVDGAELREALAGGSPQWVQNSYSLLERDAEREVLPLCSEHGLGFTPFGPLAGGWLTGKYRRGAEAPAGSRMTLRPEPYRHLEHGRVYDALDRLAAIAAGRGATMTELAFAWLLADPRVSAVVLGPRRPDQLEPALRALELDLGEDERRELGVVFSGLAPA
ncbi:MAG TPA: aldo/keto reductase [Gaiellaceae bacterium]|nr:aldo/keto reductase [Gaiellaceae bacterium]